MDAHEVTAQLREDPALAAILRGVLLGDELLRLPQAIAELAERQSRTEQRLAELVTEIAGLSRSMAELAQRQSRTEERLDRVIDDLGEVKGISLERHLREQPRRYLRKLVTAARPLGGDELRALEVELADRGARPGALDDLFLADVIAEGEMAGHPGVSVHLVIEASWRLDARDVERAARGAAIVAQSGRRALAVIVGREAPLPMVRAQARADGVAVVQDQTVLEPGTLLGVG